MEFNNTKEKDKNATKKEHRKIFEVLNERGEKFLSNLDEGKQKEKTEVEFLIETMRAEDGAQVPDVLSPNDLKILLNPSWDQRKKIQYLKRCYLLEQQEKFKQLEREEAISRVKGMFDDDLHPVVRPDRQRRWMNRWKAVQGIRFGLPVLVDMDYDLNEVEALQTIKQIQYIYKNNCEHLQPCHLHFTSVHKNNFINDLLESENGKNILADFHTEHFLTLFPRERLFYLVPEGPVIEEEDLDADTIFVLGGLAGTRPRNRSYQKARDLEIPCGSFPVEKFVSLKISSSRDLYLQYVIQILLDKFLCKSWKEALDDRLPDSKYEKYPGLGGPLPSKHAMKSRRQFEKLEKTLAVLKSVK